MQPIICFSTSTIFQSTWLGVDVEKFQIQYVTMVSNLPSIKLSISDLLYCCEFYFLPPLRLMKVKTGPVEFTVRQIEEDRDDEKTNAYTSGLKKHHRETLPSRSRQE